MNSDAETARPVAVLDSNVIVSGLAFHRGNPFEIINALERGDIRVYISSFIMSEVSQVLRRTFHRNEIVIDQALNFLRSYCTVIDPPPKASVAALTPQDNRILDCAVEGGVQYLVTGDKGILLIKDYRGIAMISPAEFLAIVSQQS